MNRSTRFIVVTAIVAVAAFGVAAVFYFATGPFRGEATSPIDETATFAPAGIATIDARTSSADIRVTRSATSEIVVRLHGEVRVANTDLVPRLIAKAANGELEIGIDRNSTRGLILGVASERLTLEVAIPGELAASLKLRASSADISIRDVSLISPDISTSSGEIDARLAELGGKAIFGSSSGAIELDVAELTGDIRIDVSSGDATLYLPADASFQLNADASSGDISVEFPLTITGTIGDRERDKVAGTIGTGTHQVDVKTSSGDIQIRQR